MKKCPYCAEKIRDEALVCRFCGRDLEQKVQMGDHMYRFEKISAEDEKNPEKRKAEDRKRLLWALIGVLSLSLIVCFISALFSVIGGKPNIPISYQRAWTYFEEIDLLCMDLEVASDSTGNFDYEVFCSGEFPEDNTDVTVSYYAGSSKRDVYLVYAHVEQSGANLSDEITLKYLSQIVSLPFEGNSPDQAILWLNLNLEKAKNASISSEYPQENFGDVAFRFIAAGEWGAYLAIGERRDE